MRFIFDLFNGFLTDWLHAISGVVDGFVVVCTFAHFRFIADRPFFIKGKLNGFSRKVCWFGGFVDIISNLIEVLTLSQLHCTWSTMYWAYVPFKDDKC